MTSTVVVSVGGTDEWRKDPADTATYEFNWGRWLPSGVTITDAVCTLDPASAGTSVIEGTAHSVTKVYPTVSGGQLNEKPVVICTITTSENLVYRTEKTITIRKRRS